MALSAGTRLGPYEILALIGAGGMGEVYKARDTRLDRTVAIKISAEQFGERFEREARAVAALNHPYICTLYDVGPNYLVMEYIEGQALKGPLPLGQALRYGVQICEALDAAHRKGIVHRDLKPANILVTKSGVKLLDFGLAKMAETSPVQMGDELGTQSLTQAGSILGTLQYMAPEQLEGKKTDARADIFSFGAVLYEMVTGRRAFEGSSSASVIGAIMGLERRHLEPLPRGLDHVVEGCLTKDPNERWQSAADLRRELEWLAEGGAPEAAAAKPVRNPWRERIAWLLAAAFFAALVFVAATRPHIDSGAPYISFGVYPAERTTFLSGALNASVPSPQFAVSPDGRAIVFAASGMGAKPLLWLRPMADVAAHPLSGTENASNPFWSPDSRWIGFFAEAKLKKISAGGGPPQVLAEGMTDPRGGAWGADDTIVFAPTNGAIFRLSAAGGPATPVTTLDKSRREGSHRFPHFLPDGRHFLFTIRAGQVEHRGIYAGSLDGKIKKFLVPSDWSGVYALPGYLLYLDGDALTARPFDAARLELTGPPLTIAEQVSGSTIGLAAVSVSRNGLLAYSGAIVQNGRLTWFSRSGEMLDSIGQEGDYLDLRLSPDDKRLAASLVDRKAGNPDIWVTDLARGSTSKFTFDPSMEATPVWSPDGSRIAFRTNRTGLIEFYEKSSAGGGAEEPLLLEAVQLGFHSTGNVVPNDWSPDSRHIIYSAPTVASRYDLWLLPASGSTPGEKKPLPFLNSPADEIQGNFSPDGHFVAYASNESGRFEVYVQTFPRSDGKWLISTHGGYEPRWRRDGRELYYLSEDRKLMVVTVGTAVGFEAGAPKPLFQTRVPIRASVLRTNYVPTRDGSRFVVNTLTADTGPAPITVVLNWTAGLKRN